MIGGHHFEAFDAELGITVPLVDDFDCFPQLNGKLRSFSERELFRAPSDCRRKEVNLCLFETEDLFGIPDSTERGLNI